MNHAASTPFTRIKRMPERAVYDRDIIHAILDAAPMCHIGHIVSGRPVVIPTLHWRQGDNLYWHGSAASRMLESNAAGSEICLTATLLDGWVLARSAFNHSANYRSVMCFGRPSAVTDPEAKLAAVRSFVERRFPARWPMLRPVTDQELKATLVLSMPIEEASAKVRATGVGDDPKDVDWPVWAGILPLQTTHGAPIADVEVRPDLSPPVEWQRVQQEQPK
jgi:nitroimidazol reductase NimA-like FMN-containing flavoprotein (pyridoxamine 5'-phosphate oxidase superfamily)